MMTRTDARIIVKGLLPNGLDVAALTPKGRQEIRDAIDKLLKLTFSYGTVRR
jgi:nucleotidyltransferase/DNA polymerase involved in DNA repair